MNPMKHSSVQCTQHSGLNKHEISPHRKESLPKGPTCSVGFNGGKPPNRPKFLCVPPEDENPDDGWVPEEINDSKQHYRRSRRSLDEVIDVINRQYEQDAANLARKESVRLQIYEIVGHEETVEVLLGTVTRKFTQKAIADANNISQPNVSKTLKKWRQYIFLNWEE